MGARDIRPYAYAAIDLVLAASYAVLITAISPTRHAGGRALLWGIVIAIAVMGAATLWRSKWGWRIAAGACGLLLALQVALLALLVSSAAFLAGVYGAFGRGAAVLTLVVAALTVQLVGLLPAFQLKFLMTRAGRRAFGLGPGRPGSTGSADSG
jgi:hypothetical protein